MFVRVAWLSLGLLAAGCAGAEKREGSADVLPRPFALELRALELGRRHVFYQLAEDGSLKYGGGRDAAGRSAPRSAGRLSQEELLQVWEIVRDNNLLHIGGELFPEGRVRYEVVLRAGSRRNRFAAAGQDVPGLKELDELLFRIQARNRFDEQTDGILPPDEEPPGERRFRPR